MNNPQDPQPGEAAKTKPTEDVANAAPDAETVPVGGAAEDMQPASEDSPDAPSSDVSEPTAEEIIAGLEAQVAELKDQALRAAAEAENVRRRAAKEKADASKFGIANLARDLLSVPDNLARAIDSVTEEAQAAGGEALQNLIEGVKLTQKELLHVLERHSIQPIYPDGEKFDPNFHQAMFEAPGTGQPDGTVVQVVQTGYLIGDRLLRPAMVGVAKGAGAVTGGESEESTDATPGSQIDTSA